MCNFGLLLSAPLRLFLEMIFLYMCWLSGLFWTCLGREFRCFGSVDLATVWIAGSCSWPQRNLESGLRGCLMNTVMEFGAERGLRDKPCSTISNRCGHSRAKRGQVINPGSQNELVAKARPEFSSLLQRPPSSRGYICVLSCVWFFVTHGCSLPGSSSHRSFQEEYWSGLLFPWLHAQAVIFGLPWS